MEVSVYMKKRLYRLPFVKKLYNFYLDLGANGRGKVCLRARGTNLETYIELVTENKNLKSVCKFAVRGVEKSLGNGYRKSPTQSYILRASPTLPKLKNLNFMQLGSLAVV